MTTIPRYLPAVDLRARFAALTTQDTVAATERVLFDLGLDKWRQVVPVAGARVGIAAFFQQLALKDARRSVLLSAQICPVVPQVLIRLGFRPVFIDIDERAPMPGAYQIMSALQEVQCASTVAAIVIAPLYGYLPDKLDEIADRLDGIQVLLDLAQGTLLAPNLPRLMARADAAVYSFGAGKGLDIGGGLLAVRQAEIKFEAPSNQASFATFAGLPAALALRTAVGVGLYQHLIPLIDVGVEANKSDVPPRPGSTNKRLPSRVFNAYAARLPHFAKEIKTARTRAAALYQLPCIMRLCRDAATFGNAAQMDLRQILRLSDPERRGQLLSLLRRAGIDALPAGEYLPETYLPDDAISVATSSAGLPNTNRFLADAIRLPFLGRMDEITFRHFLITLENTLD